MVTLTGFTDKVAVGTGGGRLRSVGREVAEQLAQAGCHVIVTGSDRSPEAYPEDEKASGWRDVDSVADNGRALGRSVLALASGVADESSVAELATRVTVEFGQVDFLVNNAGAPRGADRRTIIDLDPGVWTDLMAVNLTGRFLMSRTFGRVMAESGHGDAIVNISSIAERVLPPGAGAYAAAKAGLHALTACPAQGIGPVSVRVKAVCPGTIDTAQQYSIGSTPGWSHAAEHAALGHLGRPSDIATAFICLCSDQGSFVTGQAWNVDGGAAFQH